MHFVQSLDSSPKARSVLYYCGVARAMAEAVGSVLTEDFGAAAEKHQADEVTIDSFEILKPISRGAYGQARPPS